MFCKQVIWGSALSVMGKFVGRLVISGKGLWKRLREKEVISLDDWDLDANRSLHFALWRTLMVLGIDRVITIS